MTQLETIDLFSPATQADPFPAYRELRERMPVYREPRFGSWVLTRFDDVYGVLRDHETFSSARGISPGMRGGGMVTMITADPPRHTHLRSIVNRAFTPQRVAALRPRIQETVDELLAAFGSNSVDVVELLTYPLPVIVIAGLLGIPPADRERFKRW
jgi:cytochrome P450